MKHNLIKLLQNNKKRIMEIWIQNQIKNDILREDLITSDELREVSDELMNVLLKNLSEANIQRPYSTELTPVHEMINDISTSRARQGFTPRETGMFLLSLKNAILDVLQSEIKTDTELLYEESSKINTFIDGLNVISFENYIRGREEVIMRQTNEITEISTPVIRVWEGILAMPIIGTLDSSRTQIVMENLLQEIVTSRSSIAILDISGVPMVDSLVAQHLLKTVSATRLMGAECIISGIRPEIAQTIVHLGVDLTGIITKASLATALQYSFTHLKYEVKNKELKTA